MKIEMNIDVSICEKEKKMLDDAYCVFSNIEETLSNLKENGHYSFIDDVRLPQSVLNIVAIANRVSNLSQSGFN